MNIAFLVVSVLHSLAVLAGGKTSTKMEEGEAQNSIGAVGGWCCCVGGGVCDGNNHNVSCTGLSVQQNPCRRRMSSKKQLLTNKCTKETKIGKNNA